MSNTKSTHTYRRDDYENEVENLSQKQRFGLFSQPRALAIGDQFSKRAQTCEPLKNIYTNPTLQTHVDPPLFEQQPPYVSLQDPYRDKFKLKQEYNNQQYILNPHDKPFKCTDVKKTKIGTDFEHMKEYDEVKPHRRGSDGKIIIAPRNFYTNNMKEGKGNSTVGHLFENINYVNSNYNRPKELEFVERATQKGKILDPIKPWSSKCKKNNLFNSNRDTYGIDRDQQQGKQYCFTFSGVEHQGPFKNTNPIKKGFNNTFSAPQYMEEGVQPKKLRKKHSLHGNPWRPNSQGTALRPNPCISQKLGFTTYGKFKM